MGLAQLGWGLGLGLTERGAHRSGRQWGGGADGVQQRLLALKDKWFADRVGVWLMHEMLCVCLLPFHT